MTEWDLPRVGLITIWYQASREMDRFVTALRALQYARLQPVFVIHQQTQDEVAWLSREVPLALIEQPGGNLGTAAGWNLGIVRLLEQDVDYVGIWNVDVRLDPESVKRLVAVMEKDGTIGACQPLLLYSDEPNKVEMYGGSMDVRTGQGEHDYKGATDLSSLPPLRDTGYLDGGTMMVRADVLRRVGGFDESFFMYAEDSDLSLRIQKAGYRTVAIRDARAWHYHRENCGAFPTPHQLFYETRNRFYLVRKHAGERARTHLVMESIGDIQRPVAHFLRRRKPALAWAYVTGVLSGATGRTGAQTWVS